MSKILDDVAAVYYPIYFTSCSILHILLFYLIFNKTSKVLRTMRYFLYPSNFFNYVLAAFTFFLQFRTVHNTRSLAIMCQGPCKYFGAVWCFNGYIFILSVATAGGVLNIHTLYYRMITIKYHDNMKFRIFIFGLWYLFPIAIIVLSYIPPIDLDSVYLETLQAHPDYNFEPYRKFGGFANSHSIFMTLVTFTLVLLTIVAPTLGYSWRRQTLKVLDRNINSLSAQSVTQFRALVHGLGLQIMLPLFCYVPVGFFYIFNKYVGTQILISQYTVCFMITLPALFDPILQIYFIVPYRRAAKRILTCSRSERIENNENSLRRNTVTLWNGRKTSSPNQMQNLT
ncbi:Serpentine Receptor, class D (Delta) [Caenorhabditis elegans]|uniref:Serpentine Receptor, class D (Delta) n=1 Tax=Caenorhabditis elegans TaxID=6239 RepID=G5EF74_CAEEL|nr:Serpentine Receptor, class D (Delta) [Caenorhabditis elegans]NP_503691.2 Serpentine Receptor, class D (Delta) [Caenorhabditis elegans]CCD62302.1 Serpentine Receptor, class D (Delta) [Caenorhabditis elegans]CCD64354.1 Serpentine Receptor, class D (Delta) [Caenorhabditis elegans]|eukprot:NP_503663.1 Serpentine Receptor, class D (delta) [Caenorhabditis elegans]